MLSENKLMCCLISKLDLVHDIFLEGYAKMNSLLTESLLKVMIALKK